MGTPGSSSDGVLLTAHGTVERLGDLPAFLARIRHGRPASPELVAEVTRRYELIGGSPLLEVTRAQAELVGEALGLPAVAGMRLWDPSIEQGIAELAARGVERVCVLPLAPFSVHVYAQSVREAMRRRAEQGERELEVVSVEPWGEEPAFVAAHAALIERHAPASTALVLTAHSLPSRAIAAGDPYADLCRKSAGAIGRRLERPFRLAYQSQGADGGDWLGPDLPTTLRELAQAGARELALSPFGFLTEHVETLYDLDVEARGLAEALGLRMIRVPALGTDAGLIQALVAAARRALGR